MHLIQNFSTPNFNNIVEIDSNLKKKELIRLYNNKENKSDKINLRIDRNNLKNSFKNYWKNAYKNKEFSPNLPKEEKSNKYQRKRIIMEIPSIQKNKMLVSVIPNKNFKGK